MASNTQTKQTNGTKRPERPEQNIGKAVKGTSKGFNRVANKRYGTAPRSSQEKLEAAKKFSDGLKIHFASFATQENITTASACKKLLQQNKVSMNYVDRKELFSTVFARFVSDAENNENLKLIGSVSLGLTPLIKARMIKLGYASTDTGFELYKNPSTNKNSFRTTPTYFVYTLEQTEEGNVLVPKVLSSRSFTIQAAARKFGMTYFGTNPANEPAPTARYCSGYYFYPAPIVWNKFIFAGFDSVYIDENGVKATVQLEVEYIPNPKIEPNSKLKIAKISDEESLSFRIGNQVCIFNHERTQSKEYSDKIDLLTSFADTEQDNKKKAIITVMKALLALVKTTFEYDDAVNAVCKALEETRTPKELYPTLVKPISEISALIQSHGYGKFVYQILSAEVIGDNEISRLLAISDN